MELLIPGLILVALMVYASTRIKQRAAAAFEPESIETAEYSLKKPDGFLHVLNSDKHEFEAYSKEFGGADNSGERRATIELDVFPGGDLRSQCEELGGEKTVDAGRTCRIEVEETANESELKVVYKLVANETAVYRLRFAVLAEYIDEYERKLEETLDSFTIEKK